MTDHQFDCIADAAGESEDLIVAFASMDGDMVDQHFGSALAFYAYSVNQNSAQLIARQSFDKALQDGNEDKLKPRLKWLVGADLVYCGSIGGSATRQLITLGITPNKVKGGPDVEELIEELQQQLQPPQPFWLKNIMQKKAVTEDDRFTAYAEEDWEE